MAAPMEVEPFQLSATLIGHEDDVRSVGALGEHVVTGSRDRSVRVWRPLEAGGAHA